RRHRAWCRLPSWLVACLVDDVQLPRRPAHDRRPITCAKEHSLTKAGLRRVHIVETAELGLRPGDIVFEFPFGRIVDTGMAFGRRGKIFPHAGLMTNSK